MSDQLTLDDGTGLELDRHGHLADATQWSAAVARAFARIDGIELAPAHWAVIDELRDYHETFGIEPPMRALLARLRERLDQPALGSRELYRWFPEGPVRQGSRYAGLPLPLSCI